MDEKIIESFAIDDWEIETGTGWEEITRIHKTVQYDTWEIGTKDFSLTCADRHIVIDQYGKQVFAQDLRIGDRIKTKNGIQEITFVNDCNRTEHMYDVTVDSEEHTYYTDGILSHNTEMSKLYIIWYSLFESDKKVAILANREKTAIKILREIKNSYAMLPLWLQQGIKETGWSETRVELENGTTIICSSTASSAIRGEAVSVLFLDEFAFVPPNVADDFIASVYPTITASKTSKIIMVSTPNGLNHFYTFFKKATRYENNFKPIKINWNEVPGRDEKWKSNVIKDIGIVRWNQEYAAKFLGSTATLIDSSVLERMAEWTCQPLELRMNDFLKIYKKPERGQFYILGVDTGKGIGADYSCIQVIHIKSEFDIEQVAVYRDNYISPYNFAQICISLSQYYNEAFMMVESNDIGGQVCDHIWWEYEYDKILNCDKDGLGIRSHGKTKLGANMLLKRYVEEGWFKVIDERTVYELSMYEQIRPSIFSAPKNQHDDCVSSLAWALYFLNTQFFDEKSFKAKTIEDKYKLKETDSEMIMPVIVNDNLCDGDGFDWSKAKPYSDF